MQVVIHLVESRDREYMRWSKQTACGIQRTPYIQYASEQAREAVTCPNCIQYMEYKMDAINDITHEAQNRDLAGQSADDYCADQIALRLHAIGDLSREITRLYDFRAHLKIGHNWSEDERGNSRCAECGWNGDI